MSPPTTTSTAEDCKPQFSWDVNVSDQPFWTDFGPSGSKIARAFLSCCDGRDLADIQCDIEEKADNKVKLALLRDKIESYILAETAQVAPSQLRLVNYSRWRNLQAGLTTMEYFLGDLGKVERMGREMYEHGPSGGKDMSALHALSGVLEEEGKYAQAEAAARLVLPWLQSHPDLGNSGSPQALGSMKIIVKSLWKQGKIAEAQTWIEECNSLVNQLGHSKFKKYQEEESRQWRDDLYTLRTWK